MRYLTAPFRRFAGDERGSLSIEAVLMLPLLAWCFLGTFVFFDAYRMKSVNTKAAYTIGDTVSRETAYVTPEYVDGMYDLQNFLLNTDENVSLRVSAIGFDEDSGNFFVRWSASRGGVGDLTDAYLNDNATAIPDMDPTETAIVVETWVDYEPAYSVGISDFTFRDLTVTRPRFAGQICWNTAVDADHSTALC